MSYTNHVRSDHRSLRASGGLTPQSKTIPGRGADMVKNRAGGVAFAVDEWTRLRRFLILGADGPTFYANARELTFSSAEGVVLALEADGLRVVREVVEVSHGGLAPRNDPALFVLAMAAAFGVAPDAAAKGEVAARLTGSTNPNAGAVRRAAFDALPKVARTGTHAMQFAAYMQALRGWGRGARDAFGRWLGAMSDEKLSLQAVKYRQREGWTLRDVLRLAHPDSSTAARRLLLDWIAHREQDDAKLAAHEARVAESALSGVAREAFAPKVTPRRHRARPAADVVADARAEFRLIDGYHLAQEAASAAQVAKVIRSHGVPFECVPSQFLGDREVWDALLENMPATNMLRNLGKMSAVGLLVPGSAASRHVAQRFAELEFIRKGRLHPFNLLVAQKVYGKGSGMLGSLSWTPDQKVVDALDAAFYMAFKVVVPSGKRFMLGIDISGSMDSPILSNGKGPSPVTCREAAAAMAMVTYATEPNCVAYGFTSSGGGWSRSNNGLTPVALSTRRRLDDLCAEMRKLPMGGTDASLPVRKALEDRLEVDAFLILTDNESWAGPGHVTQYLTKYREASGIPARLVSVAFGVNEYSVADAKDAGQMDVVGFDASAPAVISDFVRGSGS